MTNLKFFKDCYFKCLLEILTFNGKLLKKLVAATAALN